MRTAVYKIMTADDKITSDIIPGIWSEYAPRTNIVWLLFLLKNLLKNRKPEPAPTAGQNQQKQRHERKPLAPCSTNSSLAGQFARTDNHNTKKTTGNEKAAATLVQQRQARSSETGGNGETQLQVAVFKKVLEERMVSVLELLDLEHGSEEMCCAADLVAYAIDEGWLDEKDFF